MPDSYLNGPEGLAKIAARRKALIVELDARPIEDVIGLVDAKGVAGWPEENDQHTLHFTFHRWEISSGPLKTRPLEVTITSSQAQYEGLWTRINSYRIFRIRARVAEDSIFGTPRARMEEFIGEDNSHPELNQAAVELQKPVVYHDQQFGLFTLERRVDGYTAKTHWNSVLISLSLELDDSGSFEKALEFARLLWNDQEQWKKRIGDFAVQKLLPLKNDNWLSEDEAPLTADQFKAKMTLESITVGPDGQFDFWHDDGDLFAGHSIEISGNLKDGPKYADTPG